MEEVATLGPSDVFVLRLRECRGDDVNVAPLRGVPLLVTGVVSQTWGLEFAIAVAFRPEVTRRCMFSFN